MKAQKALAVPVKLWAFLCVLVGITLTANGLYTPVLMLCGFVHFMFQRAWRLMLSYGIFYAVLAVLLYAIGYWGLYMKVFSEFHVLMFWTFSPALLVSWDLITTPPGEISAFLSFCAFCRLPTSFLFPLQFAARNVRGGEAATSENPSEWGIGSWLYSGRLLQQGFWRSEVFGSVRTKSCVFSI